MKEYLVAGYASCWISESMKGLSIVVVLFKIILVAYWHKIFDLYFYLNLLKQKKTLFVKFIFYTARGQFDKEIKGKKGFPERHIRISNITAGDFGANMCHGVCKFTFLIF